LCDYGLDGLRPGRARQGQQHTKVDQVAGKVTLDHERIPKLDMDAMTMAYKVKDRAGPGLSTRRAGSGRYLAFRIFVTVYWPSASSTSKSTLSPDLVDQVAGKVTLDHERIPKLDMDAMTMAYKVKDPAGPPGPTARRAREGISSSSCSPGGRWAAARAPLEGSKVTLDHERIPKLDMDAMTMAYKVKDPAMLKDLKPTGIDVACDYLHGRSPPRGTGLVHAAGRFGALLGFPDLRDGVLTPNRPAAWTSPVPRGGLLPWR
jgi:Cu/Ag efflux protein CusF